MFLFLLLLLSLLIEKSQNVFWGGKSHFIPPFYPFLQPLLVLYPDVDIAPELPVAGNYHFNDGSNVPESISGSTTHPSPAYLLLLEMSVVPNYCASRCSLQDQFHADRFFFFFLSLLNYFFRLNSQDRYYWVRGY